MKRIAVVGGGWAGLAAAVELATHGERVVVFESARQLGGRARSVPWQGIALDNGQHLMVGAYHDTLGLMRRVGSADRLERRPLELRLPGFHLRLPRLPAPLNLAWGLYAAQGLGLRDKSSAARFMHTLKTQGFRLAEDMPAAALLALHRQSAALTERLWAPICIAALNTPLEQASAQVFCNVLRDSLAGDRQASDLLLTRGDLGSLFPEPAAAFVRSQGGKICLSSRVERITRQGDEYHLAGPEVFADAVIVAVHPSQVAGLCAELQELDGIADMTAGYGWQPILTTWLRFAEPLPFPFPMLGLGGGQSPWAFERNDLAPGLVSVVVSAEGPHLGKPPERRLEEHLELLARSLGDLPELLAWKTIVEKRATYSCVPGMSRPDQATPLPGLYLAGDYTLGDYPATLEGAVRSGRRCAHLVLQHRP